MSLCVCATTCMCRIHNCLMRECDFCSYDNIKQQHEYFDVENFMGNPDVFVSKHGTIIFKSGKWKEKSICIVRKPELANELDDLITKMQQSNEYALGGTKYLEMQEKMK